ncbi:MAG: hypothetical protein U0M19_03545 [Caecibacter sp.]|nr:hypothetical protein [Caecibacter sp.]
MPKRNDSISPERGHSVLYAIVYRFLSRACQGKAQDFFGAISFQCLRRYGHGAT